MEVPEVKREKEAGRMYEEIMTENFPKLMKRLNTELPYNPAKSLLGTNPREYPHKNLFTNVHSSIIHNTKK